MRGGSLCLFAAMTAVVACAPVPEPADETVRPAVAGAQPQAEGAAGKIAVGSPWIRQPMPNAAVAAGYMVLANPGDAGDRLLAVETDAAERVEIHELREIDGVVRMRELGDGLAIPAGGEVELKPGSYHLMLLGPREGLAAGDEVPATLVFAQAGRVETRFEVRLPTGAPVQGHDRDRSHGRQ